MRKMLGLVMVAIPAIWLASPAVAGPAATLHVTPSSVAAGGTVQVSGTCEANTSGFALSHAFLHDASHDFAGVGAVSFTTNASGSFSATATIPASTTPGSYDVTARCGGGNLGITAALLVTAASSGQPTAVPAGTGGTSATGPATATTELELAAAGAALLLLGGLGARRARAHR